MLVLPWPLPRGAMDDALALLRGGALVVHPTETLYGIGVALCAGDAGVARVRAAKRSADDRPFLVLAASTEAAFALWSSVPDAAVVLARAAWPGPLTLVGPARDGLPASLLGRAERADGASIRTLSVRVPGDDALRQLLARLGEPLLSTSANQAGAAPPTRAEEVDVGGLAPDLFLRGEGALLGAPSTILTVAEDPPRVLRMGAWTPPGPR